MYCIYMYDKFLKNKNISTNLKRFLSFELFISEILFNSKNLNFDTSGCYDELTFLNRDFYLFIEDNPNFI
jgi:hypothetical protein